jgi:uncharacterized protein YdeI (YjbR/CyaY-like superfamily)
MKLGQTLYVHRRKDWRAWLAKHHATAREIWLVYTSKASGLPRISYGDAVEEALCFGWIDSTAKKVDEHHFAQRFSPRRPVSPWSEPNKARARKLIKAGLMKPAGMLALGNALRRTKLVVAPDVLAALKASPAAWRHYQRLPAAYRRIRLAFVEGARNRPAIFRTRLRYFVAMTAKNKQFGMVRG